MFDTRKDEDKIKSEFASPFERVRIVLRSVDLVLPNPPKVALFSEPRIGIKNQGPGSGGPWYMSPRFGPLSGTRWELPFLVRRTVAHLSRAESNVVSFCPKSTHGCKNTPSVGIINYLRS